jgi:hypothetical protein
VLADPGLAMMSSGSACIEMISRKARNTSGRRAWPPPSRPEEPKETRRRGSPAVAGPRPETYIAVRYKPVIRQRGSDPVGWRVSRHDMACNGVPWALTVIAMAAVGPDGHPGQAEPEATGPVAASRDSKTAQVTT